MKYFYLAAFASIIVLTGAGCKKEIAQVTPNQPVVVTDNSSSGMDTGSVAPAPVLRPILNQDPATTTIKYRDEELGFEVRLPYNPNWGIEGEKLAPYEMLYTNSLHFGPLVDVCFVEQTDCAEKPIRAYWLRVERPRTAAQVEEDFKTQSENTSFVRSVSGRKTVNGFTVVQSGVPNSDCGGIQYDIIGKRNNIIVSSGCHGLTKDTDKVLLDVISSLKLFEPKRTIVTGEYVDKNMEQLCQEKFNSDASNAEVFYEDPGRGFWLEIPYNSNWGNEKYRVPAYELFNPGEKRKGFMFGPVQTGVMEGGCGVRWVIEMEIIPARSVATIEAEHLDTRTTKPVVKEVKGLTVVELNASGLCEDKAYEIVGKHYNYQFSAVCGGEKDYTLIEQTIQNFHLFN